jgi:hypothetical protein
VAERGHVNDVLHWWVAGGGCWWSGTVPVVRWRVGDGDALNAKE